MVLRSDAQAKVLSIPMQDVLFADTLEDLPASTSANPIAKGSVVTVFLWGQATLDKYIWTGTAWLKLPNEAARLVAAVDALNDTVDELRKAVEDLAEEVA